MTPLHPRMNIAFSALPGTEYLVRRQLSLYLDWKSNMRQLSKSYIRPNGVPREHGQLRAEQVGGSEEVNLIVGGFFC